MAYAVDAYRHRPYLRRTSKKNKKTTTLCCGHVFKCCTKSRENEDGDYTGDGTIKGNHGNRKGRRNNIYDSISRNPRTSPNLYSSSSSLPTIFEDDEYPETNRQTFNVDEAPVNYNTSSNTIERKKTPGSLKRNSERFQPYSSERKCQRRKETEMTHKESNQQRNQRFQNDADCHRRALQRRVLGGRCKSIADDRNSTTFSGRLFAVVGHKTDNKLIRNDTTCEGSGRSSTTVDRGSTRNVVEFKKGRMFAVVGSNNRSANSSTAESSESIDDQTEAEQGNILKRPTLVLSPEPFDQASVLIMKKVKGTTGGGRKINNGTKLKPMDNKAIQGSAGYCDFDHEGHGPHTSSDVITRDISKEEEFRTKRSDNLERKEVTTVQHKAFLSDFMAMVIDRLNKLDMKSDSKVHGDLIASVSSTLLSSSSESSIVDNIGCKGASLEDSRNENGSTETQTHNPRFQKKGNGKEFWNSSKRTIQDDTSLSGSMSIDVSPILSEMDSSCSIEGCEKSKNHNKVVCRDRVPLDPRLCKKNVSKKGESVSTVKKTKITQNHYSSSVPETQSSNKHRSHCIKEDICSASSTSTLSLCSVHADKEIHSGYNYIVEPPSSETQLADKLSVSATTDKTTNDRDSTCRKNKSSVKIEELSLDGTESAIPGVTFCTVETSDTCSVDMETFGPHLPDYVSSSGTTTNKEHIDCSQENYFESVSSVKKGKQKSSSLKVRQKIKSNNYDKEIVPLCQRNIDASNATDDTNVGTDIISTDLKVLIKESVQQAINATLKETERFASSNFHKKSYSSSSTSTISDHDSKLEHSSAVTKLRERMPASFVQRTKIHKDMFKEFDSPKGAVTAVERSSDLDEYFRSRQDKQYRLRSKPPKTRPAVKIYDKKKTKGIKSIENNGSGKTDASEMEVMKNVDAKFSRMDEIFSHLQEGLGKCLSDVSSIAWLDDTDEPFHQPQAHSTFKATPLNFKGPTEDQLSSCGIINVPQPSASEETSLSSKTEQDILRNCCTDLGRFRPSCTDSEIGCQKKDAFDINIHLHLSTRSLETDRWTSSESYSSASKASNMPVYNKTGDLKQPYQVNENKENELKSKYHHKDRKINGLLNTQQFSLKMQNDVKDNSKKTFMSEEDSTDTGLSVIENVIGPTYSADTPSSSVNNDRVSSSAITDNASYKSIESVDKSIHDTPKVAKQSQTCQTAHCQENGAQWDYLRSQGKVRNTTDRNNTTGGRLGKEVQQKNIENETFSTESKEKHEHKSKVKQLMQFFERKPKSHKHERFTDKSLELRTHPEKGIFGQSSGYLHKRPGHMVNDASKKSENQFQNIRIDCCESDDDCVHASDNSRDLGEVSSRVVHNVLIDGWKAVYRGAAESEITGIDSDRGNDECIPDSNYSRDLNEVSSRIVHNVLKDGWKAVYRGAAESEITGIDSDGRNNGHIPEPNKYRDLEEVSNRLVHGVLQEGWQSVSGGSVASKITGVDCVKSDKRFISIPSPSRDIEDLSNRVVHDALKDGWKVVYGGIEESDYADLDAHEHTRKLESNTNTQTDRSIKYKTRESKCTDSLTPATLKELQTIVVHDERTVLEKEETYNKIKSDNFEGNKDLTQTTERTEPKNTDGLAEKDKIGAECDTGIESITDDSAKGKSTSTKEKQSIINVASLNALRRNITSPPTCQCSQMKSRNCRTDHSKSLVNVSSPLQKEVAVSTTGNKKRTILDCSSSPQKQATVNQHKHSPKVETCSKGKLNSAFSSLKSKFLAVKFKNPKSTTDLNKQSFEYRTLVSNYLTNDTKSPSLATASLDQPSSDESKHFSQLGYISNAKEEKMLKTCSSSKDKKSIGAQEHHVINTKTPSRRPITPGFAMNRCKERTTSAVQESNYLKESTIKSPKSTDQMVNGKFMQGVKNVRTSQSVKKAYHPKHGINKVCDEGSMKLDKSPMNEKYMKREAHTVVSLAVKHAEKEIKEMTASEVNDQTEIVHCTDRPDNPLLKVFEVIFHEETESSSSSSADTSIELWSLDKEYQIKRNGKHISEEQCQYEANSFKLKLDSMAVHGRNKNDTIPFYSVSRTQKQQQQCYSSTVSYGSPVHIFPEMGRQFDDKMVKKVSLLEQNDHLQVMSEHAAVEKGLVKFCTVIAQERNYWDGVSSIYSATGHQGPTDYILVAPRGE